MAVMKISPPRNRSLVSSTKPRWSTSCRPPGSAWGEDGGASTGRRRVSPEPRIRARSQSNAPCHRAPSAAVRHERDRRADRTEPTVGFLSDRPRSRTDEGERAGRRPDRSRLGRAPASRSARAGDPSDERLDTGRTVLRQSSARSEATSAWRAATLTAPAEPPETLIDWPETGEEQSNAVRRR